MPDLARGSLCRAWHHVHRTYERDLTLWARDLGILQGDRRSVKRQLRVLSLSVLVFGDLILAQRWLCHPRFPFEGISPLEVLQKEGGAERVGRFLLQILHGLYL